MKLHPRKGGHGHVTSYMLIIGSAEARSAGFVTADGERPELEKTVDVEKQTILVQVKRQAPPK